MATLVRPGWPTPALRERCNLLVVGGDLDHPSAEEAASSRASRARCRRRGGRRGLLLAGHRANATTIAWLARPTLGRPGDGRPGGVYVSASLKEEFGIAILEAMAVGLVVVAPDGGGPATYVADGETGILADTSSRRPWPRARPRSTSPTAPGAALREPPARDVVRERFGIDTMAASLAEVYPASRRGTASPPGAMEGAS